MSGQESDGAVSPITFEHIKEACEDDPAMRSLVPYLDDMRRGLAFMLVLAKRAGNVGKVAVEAATHRDGTLVIVDMDDVDGVLAAVIKGIESSLIDADGDDWHRRLTTRPLSSETLNDSGKVNIGLVVDGGKTVLSTMLHATEAAIVPLAVRDACDGDGVDIESETIKDEVSAFLEGSAKTAERLELADRPLAFQKMRALRAFGSRVPNCAQSAHDSYVSRDAKVGDAIACSSSIFVCLDEPVRAHLGDDPDVRWRFVDQGDGAAIDGPDEIEDKSMDLRAFVFSVPDFVALGRFARKHGNDAARVPLTEKSEVVSRLTTWWDVRENGSLFRMAVPAVAADRPSFLVPGAIPMGMVTVLAASPGAGKSALMLHVCLLTQIPPERRGAELPLLGMPASEIGYGRAVLLTAEETHDELYRRKTLIRVGTSSALLMPCNGWGLEAALANLEEIPNLALVVFDSMRRFCDGDLDRSEVVTPWMDKLQAFAQRKGCAVVVIHHLNKGAGRRPGGLVDDIHGSGAVVSNARVVLTMQKRAGDMVSMKVALSKLADVKERELGPFVRDEGTWTLAKAGADTARKDAPEASEMDVTVYAALEAAIGEGAKVTRTGRRELYELKRSELAGLSRAKIRASVQAVILSGRIILEDDGCLAISRSASQSGGVADVAKVPAGNGNELATARQ